MTGMLERVGFLPPESELSQAEAQKVCRNLGAAVQPSELGKIVQSLEELILHYYKDVRAQAQKSFAVARWAAQFGFYVLLVTLAYVLIFDALLYFRVGQPTTVAQTGVAVPQDTGHPTTVPQTGVAVPKDTGHIPVGIIGLVSGALIEFISAIAFWLYSRGAKQFSAFHICLERTHRYLLAYKIAEQIKDTKMWIQLFMSLFASWQTLL